jgi:RNA polymerase subunit RPABC4/transcription elongation factor Spt4
MTRGRGENTMITCKQCGRRLEGWEHFCPGCGAQLHICPNCGTLCEPGDRFCQCCGWNLAEKKTTGPTAPVRPSVVRTPVPYKDGGTTHKILPVVLAVLVIAGLSFGGYRYYSANKKPAVQQTQEVQGKAAPKQAKAGQQAAQNAVRGTIHGTYVYIRSGPGTNFAPRGYYQNGEAVEILKEQGNWFQVKRGNGQVGWVSGDYCRKMK